MQLLAAACMQPRESYVVVAVHLWHVVFQLLGWCLFERQESCSRRDPLLGSKPSVGSVIAAPH